MCAIVRRVKLPTQAWLRLVVAATVLVFVGGAVYLYAFRLFDWLESDAAVPVLLARRVLEARLPIAGDWYYANGDVWILAPHLFAVVPVALLGVGPLSLWLGVVVGFVIETAIFVRLYRVLGGERWLAMFAAAVALMAWSNVHVKFEYIQLIYSCYATLWFLAFTLVATIASGGRATKLRWSATAVLVALVSLHNPSRSLVYVLVPVITACAWLRFDLHLRLRISAVALISWSVGFVAYTKLLPHVVAFSVPRGHSDFVLADASGIATNLGRLGDGFVMLCASGDEPGVRMIPAVFAIAGALAFVAREACSRALTPLRFVSVALGAQLVLVLASLVFGNLLVDMGSVRYLLPCLVVAFGLAAILATRALAEPGWWRRLAIGWLVALPVTAIVGLFDTSPPPAERYVWPDAAETRALGDAIQQRGLTRGFANVLTAGLMTVDTHGAALICPIYFRDFIMPQRWLTQPSCYRQLPERFFVVADQTEHDRTAIAATLPAPIEKFSVGPTYEVYVFRTADTSPAWLDLPLPENDKTAFPLRIAATHLQLRRGKVALENSRLVATGETGTVLYGPYITLPRGRYHVTWSGNGVPSRGEIKFFILADGQEKLAEASFLATALPTVPGKLVDMGFTLEAPREKVEFSVYSQDGGRAALDELVITRR